ncbi:MAG: protein kinase [Wenzhouxiangellaceae bacterium]
MSVSNPRSLRELFEACLEYPPDEQRDAARALCADAPELLEPLLDLLQRDLAFGGRDAPPEPTAENSARLARLGQFAMADQALRGLRIGPFRVAECIGVGGMGSVHRMHRVDGQVQQSVALKVLKTDFVNPALLGRFTNEQRVLASLTHPGICRFLDAGALPDGRPYVVMELIEGTPILRWCDQHRLGLRQRLELFLEVLAAVGHAHRMLVVHRDIKSSNVLVSTDGQVKLLDFGIAKSLQARIDDATGTSERFLTTCSTAPEHYLGEPVGVGCDIYALGQLLYELLCGRPPFDYRQMSAAEFERTLLHQPAPPMTRRCLELAPDSAAARGAASLPDLRRQLRGDLELVVLKCLRKKPNERHASVEQLEAELRRILERRPIQARQGERWYRLRKFVTRNRVAVSLTAALAAVVLAAALVATWQAVQMGQERARAVLERDRAQYAVNLLRDAFVSADPARLLGGEVTAREILGSAREPLATLSTEQPELFASLALVLGDVELSLMMSESAAEIIEQGIEAGERADAPASLQRELWMKLAEALVDSSHGKRLETALERVRTLDAGVRADRLRVEGRRVLFRQQPEQAVPLLEQALRMVRTDANTEGHDDKRVELSIRNDLATAYDNIGEHDQSLELYAETLRWLEQHHPAGHPQEVLTRMRRIDVQRRAGKLDDAEAEAESIHQKVIDSYGERSAMTGRWYVTRAMLATALGRPSQAIDYYSRATAAWEDTLGPDHPNHLRVAINLAAVLAATEGRAGDAEKTFRHALDLAERQYGSGSRTGAMIRAHLAALVRDRRGDREALAVLLGDPALAADRALGVGPWRQQFADLTGAGKCEDTALSRPVRNVCMEARAALTR